MTKIKLVAWDVYGTIIADYKDETTDNEESNRLELRPGALEALTEINSRKILQCTCSDGHLGNLKNNLKEAGITWLDYFIDLYKMNPGEQKDFSDIIEEYKIKSENLLVIGDNHDIDIALAKKQGCKTLWVPKKDTLDVKNILELLV